MDTVNIESVLNAIKKEKLNYFNFYNLDLDVDQYNTIKYYVEKHDIDNIDIDQKLNILLTDIEVYLNNRTLTMDELNRNTECPINAMTLYSTFEKTYHIYFLIHPVIKDKFSHDPSFLKKVENQIKSELIKDNYLEEHETIKLYTFDDEFELIVAYWLKIHEIDPSVITG